MSIYIGGPILVDDYSAMQGPCPDGFHVPLSTEWQAIYDAYTGLGLSGGANFSTYLKIPLTGFRLVNKSVLGVGSAGNYWSSTYNDASTAHILSINTSTVTAQGNGNRSLGFSVRCFKDSPTIPTTSWTILYQGSGSAGIFHNPTDGLISISSDGITRYTLMDKNLGATTVYNYGDTLTDANCGNVFQRGNNYAFPGTKSSASITDSNTQVNVTGYGPGNYYESSTWITTNPRQSSANNGNDLWGGETGVQQKTKSVEVQNIYIGEYTPEFATRGPAPEGFHVPLYTEWQGLYTIMSGLGLTTTGNSWRINLHMPFVGYRSWSSAEIGNQGSNGRYWSSSPVEKSTNHNDARYLWISSSSVGANYGDPRTQAYSVRCFKNSYVTPDSSWTVVQGTLGSAGIFRNQTKGLISITSDGTTGYTIQDKNLGATAVYNDGNTLSEANCGKYYQWGNNYGFPFTGSVTTSSTQVDTTGYGPGNYYSSNTFITRSGDYRDWSSVQNDNLRGGEDGNVPV